MTVATLPAPMALSASALADILEQNGLQLELAEPNEIIARWPVPPARVPHDGRRVVVLNANEDGTWRGAIMVGSGAQPNCYGLIDSKTRLKDLLHVEIWLRAHAPKRVARVAGSSSALTAEGH